MKILLYMLGALALIVTLVFSSAESFAQKPTPAPIVKVRSELVLVPTIVKDKHGAHVPGLTKDDFKILENGKAQNIKLFEEVITVAERPRDPRTVTGSSTPTEFTNRISPETSSKQHRLTIIAFDLLNMPTLRQADARKALWAFFGDAASTMEPTAVYSIDSRGVNVVSDFTTDPALVREALNRVKMGRQVAAGPSRGGTPHESPKTTSENDQNVPTGPVPSVGPGAGRMTLMILQMEALQRELELNVTSQLRRYTVLETLAGMQQIAQACALIPGRKALIWVTGGFPFDISPTNMMIHGQEPAIRGGRADWSDVYGDYLRTWRALNDSQVTLYPVDVRGFTNPAQLGPDVMNPGRLEGALAGYQQQQTNTTEHAFAYATGGRVFYGSDDLKKSFEEAVRDSDKYYLLGYYVAADANTKPGWHPISVKSTRKGVEVRARGGYFYLATAADLQVTRQRDLSAALFSPIDFTAVGLTARWKQTSPGAAGAKHVGFELVMPPDFADVDETDNNHIMLDIVAQAKTLEGTPVGDAFSRTLDGHLNELQLRELRERGLTYAAALALPPGDYVVRFAVRDGLNGRMGSVAAPLKVAQ